MSKKGTLASASICFFLSLYGSEVSQFKSVREWKDNFEALLEATEQLDEAKVKDLTKHGYQEEYKRFWQIITPLRIAALSDEPEAINIAKHLIEKGASVSKQGLDGKAPLHVACQFDNEQMARTLLLYGADMEAADKFGNLPIHNAILSRSHKALAALLENGQDVNLGTEEEKSTALHLAVAVDDQISVTMLLDYGANFLSRDQLGITPLAITNIDGFKHTGMKALLTQKAFDLCVNKVKNKPELVDKPQCVVCLNPVVGKQGYFLDCCHQFHKKCFLSPDADEVSKKCFTCRNILPTVFNRSLVIEAAKEKQSYEENKKSRKRKAECLEE